MENFKGTPGPWVLGKTKVNGVEQHLIISNSAIPVISFSHTEFTGIEYKSDEEKRANSNLIIAAPDLLAACQSALTELEMWIPATDVAVLDKVKAAINKTLTT